MPENIYRVVEFTDEKTLAVIPSTWLDGQSCALWPPHEEAVRCRNACRRREVPGDEWQSFPIKEWFATSQQNRFLIQSDSDHDLSPTLLTLPTLPAPPALSGSQAPLSLTPKKPLLTNPRASTSASSPQLPHDMVRTSAIEPILHRIFKSLEEIKADQSAIRRKIEKLREERPEPPSDNLSSLGNMFPLKTQVEINNFERRLQDAAFQSRVIWHLGAFNGRNITDGVRKMLEETLDHGIALRYNLSGKGKTGKRSFQQLLLYKSIFDAIRKRYTDVTDREYRSVLVNWFGGAKDRQGGRKRQAQEAQGELENNLQNNDNSDEAN